MGQKFFIMNNYHLIAFGATAKGKSNFLKKYSEQEGISYEEAERRCQPTEKMLAIQRKQKEEKDLRNVKRLQAVRDAYWSASDEEEFDCIHDSCFEILDMKLSKEQVKRIFDSLPESIIGSGIKWGFDDTVVGDDIYCYVRDNAETIQALAKNAK